VTRTPVPASTCFIVTLSAVLLGGMPVQAQAPSPPTDGGERWEKAIVTEAGQEALFAQLARLRGMIARGDEAAVKADLAALVATTQRLGIVNATEVSAYLGIAAGEASRSGKHGLAHVLAEGAAQISPERPAFRMVAARTSLGQGLDHAGEHIDALVGAVRAVRRDAVAGLRVLANLAGGLQIVLSALLVLMAAAFAARYGTDTLHAVAHRLRLPVEERVVAAIGIPIALLPLAAGLGALGTALLWIAATIGRARAVERTAALVILTGACAWPATERAIVAASLVEGTPAAAALRCERDLCGEADLATLRVTAEGKGPWAERATLALATRSLRKAMQSAEAEIEAEQAIAAVTPAAKQSTAEAERQHLAGMLHIAQAVRACRAEAKGKPQTVPSSRRFAEADAALADAIARAGHFSSRWNLFFVSRGRSKAESLESQRNALLEIDAIRFAALESLLPTIPDACPVRFEGNVDLLPFHSTPPVAAWELALAGWKQTEAYPWEDVRPIPSARIWLGRLPSSALPALAIVALMLALLARLFMRTPLRLARCTQCSSVVCARCNPETDGMALCMPCALARLQATVSDPRAEWVRMRQAEGRERARKAVFKGAGVLAPGLGAMLTGAAWSGLAHAGLPLFFVSLVWSLHSGPLPPLTPGVELRLPLLEIGAALLVLVAYASAIRSTWRRDDGEEEQ